jgi:uncharacterized membrane protein|nr:MAG TPA: putative membrane protein [Caudoviricetes sp.]DAM73419.1 MAG TPA: putative membrane protein [Caudoviricetes sp.]DAS26327.1 MAG TPA: putative membrane protein [Caudoviricetes sp.]
MNKKDEKWVSLMEYGHKIGCHQMPERSFFYKGYQFPVCARCTGVIIGEIICIITILVNIKLSIILYTVLLLIMGLDWFIQYINILESNNIRRLITGILGGFGLTGIYYYVIVNLIKILKSTF